MTALVTTQHYNKHHNTMTNVNTTLQKVSQHYNKCHNTTVQQMLQHNSKTSVTTRHINNSHNAKTYNGSDPLKGSDREDSDTQKQSSCWWLLQQLRPPWGRPTEV